MSLQNVLQCNKKLFKMSAVHLHCIVTEKDVIVHIDCLQSATIKMKFMLFQFNLELEMWW